ncbi:MAG: hypothetical protein QGI09_08185, partial [Dehalococcoidia bacterium]|nr:hypothetical protein [Dehalococcoidia bacterium]
MLQRTREGLRRLLQEHRLLDTPWSLGSLVTHYLPPDALIDVLEVWEWSLAIGVPLTIREAQWTARLRS